MKVKLIGRYVVVDIGKIETKFVEMSIKDSVISLHASGVFSEMSEYISEDDVLINVDKFCDELIKAFGRFNILATDLYITSSVLNIATQFVEWGSKEYPSIKDMHNHFESLFGRKTSNVKISDWQMLGKVREAAELKTKVVIATGEIPLFEGLSAGFKDRKYQLLGIEPSNVALTNLSILKEVTYDMPSQILIDLGSKTTLEFYKDNAHVSEMRPPIYLHDSSEDLAKELNIEALTARHLLTYVGYERSQKTEKLFEKENLTEDDYFEALEKVLAQEIAELSDYISVNIESRSLGNTKVVLTGGILDKPGFYDLFKKYYTLTEFEKFEITEDILKESFEIKNKQDIFITSKFATCIGVMLKSNLDLSINIYPQELITVQLFRLVTRSIKVFTAIAILVGIVSVGLISWNIFDWFRYREVDDYLIEMTSRHASIQALDSKYNNYISNLVKVDDISAPLMEFLLKYNNGPLRIATVDSADVLAPVVSQVAPVSPDAPEIKEASEDKKKDDKTSSVPAKEKEYKKPNIIIRGYSTDSTAITDLFKRLDEQAFTPSVSMNGVKQIVLPSEEIVYIFEIEVGRS